MFNQPTLNQNETQIVEAIRNAEIENLGMRPEESRPAWRPERNRFRFMHSCYLGRQAKSPVCWRSCPFPRRFRGGQPAKFR